MIPDDLDLSNILNIEHEIQHKVDSPPLVRESSIKDNNSSHSHKFESSSVENGDKKYQSFSIIGSPKTAGRGPDITSPRSSKVSKRVPKSPRKMLHNMSMGVKDSPTLPLNKPAQIVLPA